MASGGRSPSRPRSRRRPPTKGRTAHTVLPVALGTVRRVAAAAGLWKSLLARAAIVCLIAIAFPLLANAPVAAADSLTSTFAEQPRGAAAGTVGGAGGQAVSVTSLADKGPGTLRDAVSVPGRFVSFAVSGTIALITDIPVSSLVTIDGRGADITITARGLVLEAVHDVIIRNLKVLNGTGDSNDDAIAVKGGSRNIWIDHDELASYPDGLLDVTQQSTNVTISWNVLRDHGKGMLLGAASPGGTPELVDITIDHNWFLRIGERTPRMRHGRFHVFDNVVEAFGYSNDSGSGLRAGCGAIVLVESTTFLPVFSYPKAVYYGEADCDVSRAPAIRVSDVSAGTATVLTSLTELVPGPGEWPASTLVSPDR